MVFLRLKSWDIASMLGFANMSGTWDTMWTGPKTNFPRNKDLSPYNLVCEISINIDK